MSMPREFQPLIRASCARIMMTEGLTFKQRQMLQACVWAMADEFPDVEFKAIPDPLHFNVLEFFCDAAKHHWARLTQGEEITPASYTSHAIRCPFSDAAIIGLVTVYESLGVRLWEPQQRPNPNDLCEERRTA